MNIIDCIGNTPLIKEAEEKKLLTKDKIILEPTSKLANQIYDEEPEKYFIPNQDEDAFNTTRKLATKEGIFVGMSSGAAVHCAIEIGSELKKGLIVVLLPDRGDRYLPTSLFVSVCSKCPP